MSADPTSIERIRNATFATARRGYKKQDVDQFLARLTDWLEENSGQEASVASKQALQEVGQRTSGILVAAQNSAEEILEAAQKERQEADAYANDVREKADRQAEATRKSSEADAQKNRSEAERDAEEQISRARAAVRKIEEEGEAKKAELGVELEDLKQRRVEILRRVEELATQLTGTANEHRQPGQPNGPAPEAAGAPADAPKAEKPASVPKQKTKSPA